MDISEDEAQEQLQANIPDVRQGQVWRQRGRGENYIAYPTEVRIICRYPFAKPEDGRMWVVEKHPGLGKLWRIPELTLRVLYDVHHEAPAS